MCKRCHNNSNNKNNKNKNNGLTGDIIGAEATQALADALKVNQSPQTL